MRSLLKPLFSIRSKLALSFVALTAVFMALYLGLAQKTLREDKQLFVYRAQQAQVTALAREFDEHADQILLEARALLLGYDAHSEHLTAIAQKLFWENPNLLALDISRVNGVAQGLNLEKLPGLLKQARKVNASEPAKLVAKAIGENHFVLALKVTTPEALTLRVVMNMASALGNPLINQVVALVDGQEVVSRSIDPRVNDSDLDRLASQLAQTKFDMTNQRQIGQNEFTVSSAHARSQNLAWIAVLPNRTVFAALDDLTKRSFMFLLAALMAGLGLALVFSRRLSVGLTALNDAAERLGRGDFSNQFVLAGSDELGILGQRLENLGSDIRNLVSKTDRNARRAQESETQAAVERHIFPRQKFYRNGAVRLSGLQRQTSVAAGDWWFYFQSGTDLFVILADATGSGIESALLTATARSVLTTLDRATTTVVRIAEAIDRAIDECSNGEARLSGIVLRLNVESGECEALSASHEPPVYLTRNSQKLSANFITGRPNFAFGERPGVWFAERFGLARGDRLLLYTKGLLGVANKSGTLYSDRRLLEYFERDLSGDLDPVDVLAKLEKHFSGLNTQASVIALDFR